VTEARRRCGAGHGALPQLLLESGAGVLLQMCRPWPKRLQAPGIFGRG
jgi:hypothetical protein